MRTIFLATALTSLLVADPALTVYNQNFAIVRETVPLDLKPGVNPVQFVGVTSQLEPQSVLLRDPANGQTVLILEQSYRADPISVENLLIQNEGNTLDFLARNGDRVEIVRGKIIRAGSIGPKGNGPSWFAYPQMVSHESSAFGPVIEVDGKLRFELPGTPLFPSLGERAQLKPSLNWLLQAPTATRLNAELSYSSRGFNWEADYNIVQGADSRLDITAWITVDNRSGKTFENAQLKLMAGDVRKLQRHAGMAGGAPGGLIGGIAGALPSPPQINEKTFDEYYLYTVNRPVTLRDKEAKQIEFVQARDVSSELVYVYDGARIDWNRWGMAPLEMRRQDSAFGSEAQPKVWVMREFVNSQENKLGIPLPKGRVRFYRRDTDGRLEFTGEDTIDHTPKDERIRVFTGAAFDLVGDRKRTRFQIDHARSSAEEAFEVTVRNRKSEAVQVRIVEHMYRWLTWEIATQQPFTRRDGQTVEFTAPLAPGESKTVTYTVRYQW